MYNAYSFGQTNRNIYYGHLKEMSKAVLQEHKSKLTVA